MDRTSSRVVPLATVLLLMTGGAALPAHAEGRSGRGDIAWDPWERVNRATFAFNEELDAWVLEPVATGWDYALPHPAQRCIGNFFDHLVLPVRVVNDVLQLKVRKALEDVFRFQANTLLGLGGCFDVATHGGIPKHDEDFGQTLGHWGVPPGPYLVLPVFGASSPRDGVGLFIDSSMAVQSFFISWPILAGAAAIDVVNARAMSLEDVAAERASAFDFYAAVRGAYTQYRENRVHDFTEATDPGPTDPEDDLYYYEDDEEFDDE